MALNRLDMIDICSNLGLMFVQDFDLLYKYPKDPDVTLLCAEMQTWFDRIHKLRLKNNGKHLNSCQRKDWFYSFGSSYEEEFNNDPDEIETYEEFIDVLEENKSVQKTVEEIFYKE